MKPNLRFPEFVEPWRKTTLSEIFTFKNGVNAAKEMYGRGRKFINVMDVILDMPITYDSIIGSVDISDQEFAKNEVRYGDILFQRSSETREQVGQSNIYLDVIPATFGGFVIRGRPKVDIESRFFEALLKTNYVRRDITSRSGGSTRYNIGQESLEAVTIYVSPTRDEQKKIADFLSAIDERVKLLRRRRDGLAQYRAGIMQRLFDQSMRFNRDDGTAFPDWEEKPFAQLVDRISSKFNPQGSNEQPFTIELENIEAGTGKILGQTNFSDQLSLKSRFKKGDVLFGKLRPYLRKFWLADTSGICSTEIWVFRGRDVCSTFLYYLVQTERFVGVASQSSGSKMPRADWGVVSKEKYLTPHVDEQRKIANALSALDDKIAAVSSQIRCTSAFKKGLLQKMFV